MPIQKPLDVQAESFFETVDLFQKQNLTAGSSTDIEIIIGQDLYWYLFQHLRALVIPLSFQDANYQSYFYWKGIRILNQSNIKITIL
jgi:hypothetical protein